VRVGTVAEAKGEREGALRDERHVRHARIQRLIASQISAEIQIMSLLTRAIQVGLVSDHQGSIVKWSTTLALSAVRVYMVALTVQVCSRMTTHHSVTN
jgi:hypothetical protein